MSNESLEELILTELHKRRGRPPNKPAPVVSLKKINKSAWIRQHPAEVTAKELVEKAKREGFTLTPAQVYTARSQNKINGGEAAVVHTTFEAPRRGRPPKVRVAEGDGIEGLIRAIVRSEIKKFFSEQ